MDIQATKIELTQLLLRTNDISLLKKIKTLLIKSKGETDWWDEISITEKVEIEEGIAQADSGQVISNEEVIKSYKKWL